MHRTYLFIASDADLEYTKKKILFNAIVNDAVLEYIYQKEQKLKSNELKK